MDSPPHKKQYGAGDFQRYYQGTMPAAEMHALEKAALEDPFLGDALEGYAYTKKFDKDNAELQKRFAARLQKETKPIPLRKKNEPSWLRIAAMLCVLVGAGWGVYELSKRQEKDIALNGAENKTVSKEQPPESVVPQRNEIAGSDANDVKENKNKPAVDKTTATSAPLPAASGQILKSEKTRATKEKQSLDKESRNENDQTDLSAVLSAEVSKPATDSSSRDVTMEGVVNKAAPFNLFQGRVTDTKGMPLPYVSILSKTNKVATTTDLNGYFSLQSSDTTINATVSVIGFEINHAFLNAPSQNTIVLKEAPSALSEIVVTGYGQKSKREARKQIIESGELEPAEGWQRFDEYIIKNLKVPEDVQAKPLTGEVALSFEIDKSGEPINIKVDKSLCTGCDEEAVRLLKEGPKWKKQRGKKGRVKIKF